MLPELRFPFDRSRGRRYPEPSHPYRNPFQRDRDRVIHTRAFRRLEDKTQVFTPDLSDHFRNRLTHTLEVAQIARTVASVLQLDEDLTEALALSHDIGHPPFAHAGEEELDRQMQRFGDRFDHNLQALRIVENLEHRYIQFPGLNLTFEVREGIVKHSRDPEPGEFPELDEYLPGFKPALEAQLIDLADEAAYNTADVDDAYSAGLLDPAALAAAVPGYAEIMETVESQYPGASGREQFQESLRRLVDLLVSGLIEGTLEAARASGVQSAEEVRHAPQRLARFTAPAEQARAAIKSFLHAHVYHSPELRAERQRTTGMIAELFDFYTKNPHSLPDNLISDSSPQPVHRVVCDYIAGMTDGYFRRTYQQVFSPRG